MKRINNRMVDLWIGSDHTSKEELITLLTEIINGEYLVEEFKADVLDLWGDEE